MFNTYRVRNHFVPNPVNSKSIRLKKNLEKLKSKNHNIEKVRTNEKICMVQYWELPADWSISVSLNQQTIVLCLILLSKKTLTLVQFVWSNFCCNRNCNRNFLLCLFLMFWLLFELDLDDSLASEAEECLIFLVILSKVGICSWKIRQKSKMNITENFCYNFCYNRNWTTWKGLLKKQIKTHL